jgi:hypothetical protein
MPDLVGASMFTRSPMRVGAWERKRSQPLKLEYACFVLCWVLEVLASMAVGCESPGPKASILGCVSLYSKNDTEVYITCEDHA